MRTANAIKKAARRAETRIKKIKEITKRNNDAIIARYNEYLKTVAKNQESLSRPSRSRKTK